MTPVLNWRELAVLVEKIRPEVEGLFFERIFVPERKLFPSGYLKGEWAIRLTGRKQETTLLVSIRPRHPYLVPCEGKGPRASIAATHSPFEMMLSKTLKGSRVSKIEAILKERLIVLWLDGGEGESKLGLVLVLIPSAPEAFLVSRGESGWPILARSRTIKEGKEAITVYLPPDGAQAPVNPEVRTDILGSSSDFFKVVEKELEVEAFAVRLQTAEKALRIVMKQAQDRVRQSETALREAEGEEDWQKYGDLLKASLGMQGVANGEAQEEVEAGVGLGGGCGPELNSQGTQIRLLDYETGEAVEIPADPKLKLKAQLEKYYHNARRKIRRIQESKLRIEQFSETIEKFKKALTSPPKPGDWKGLEQLERLSGTQVEAPTVAGTGKPKKHAAAWLGKTFQSKDGQTIWVGRSKDENLELTFKCARGNDMWMHVRGRPGAHLVIPLQPGKSVPLETLLDAAHLVIHYSNGANWGKTEVDYTYKKYVKRIKDSSEASYTHNKTLLVAPDSARLKRLLGQQK